MTTGIVIYGAGHEEELRLKQARTRRKEIPHTASGAPFLWIHHIRDAVEWETLQEHGGQSGGPFRSITYASRS